MSISRVAAEINMKNNNLCRYYAATEDGTVVSWFRFLAGEAQLTCESREDAELLFKICKMFGVSCDFTPYCYHSKPYWYIEDSSLFVTRYSLESENINEAWSVREYIAEHTVGKLIDVTREKWDFIGSDYKGTWQDYYDECPEWKGRKVVMSGCITEDPAELGMLLIEGVHFRITGKETYNEQSI